MAETPLPSTYRGKGRNTPQEHITFEYRIDRKHRLLRRSHMFPNDFHPSKTEMTRDFYVCNSVHTHNLRGGLVYLAPGKTFPFPDYPNEHLLLHLSGTAEWRIEGETYRPERGAQIFTPAFASYEVANTGDTPVWLLSCYIRVTEWLGTSQEETKSKPGCERHRYMAAPPRAAGGGVVIGEALEASRNRGRTIDLPAGGALYPQHLPLESVWILLEGKVSWHVDGHDLVQEPEDMLFIPMMTPFSCRADGGARLVRYEVELDGLSAGARP